MCTPIIRVLRKRVTAARAVSVIQRVGLHYLDLFDCIYTKMELFTKLGYTRINATKRSTKSATVHTFSCI